VTTQAYFLPQSIEEATSLLDERGPEMLLMAGGTLAMPLINSGISMPEEVMGLRRAGLAYIKKTNDRYYIGATTTLSQMIVQTEIPILKDAAQAVGGWAIRNMGTVGGNLFAPPPGGDFAVALLALDAELKLTSSKGERIIQLNDFYTGFLTTSLSPDEIVTEIQISIPKGKSAYLKFGRRHANTPSIVTVAANLIFNGDTVKEARISLNAVGPHPLRSIVAEEFLVGKPLNEQNIDEASELAAEESEPFSDPIASEWYRRKMIPIIVRRTLNKIAS
jgi:CO/xanthine dehydrogenase FAD-binding subunit